jgi:hypothetical protein
VELRLIVDMEMRRHAISKTISFTRHGMHERFKHAVKERYVVPELLESSTSRPATVEEAAFKTISPISHQTLCADARHPTSLLSTKVRLSMIRDSDPT